MWNKRTNPPQLGQAISSSKQQFINESQNNAPFPVDTVSASEAATNMLSKA